MRRLHHLLRQYFHGVHTPRRQHPGHAAAAKLPRIRLHDARHSAASLLAGIGTPIVVAAGLLGHHPNVYATVYAHLYPEDKEKAINGLESVLLAEAK